MILNLAVIESLEAFFFSLCLLVSFWICPRMGKIHHFSVPELFGACELLCYCFSLRQICNSCIFLETIVEPNPQIQSKSQQNLPSFSQLWIEIDRVRNILNQTGKVKNSPRTIKLLTKRVVGGIITKFGATLSYTLSTQNIKFPNTRIECH